MPVCHSVSRSVCLSAYLSLSPSLASRSAPSSFCFLPAFLPYALALPPSLPSLPHRHLSPSSAGPFPSAGRGPIPAGRRLTRTRPIPRGGQVRIGGAVEPGAHTYPHPHTRRSGSAAPWSQAGMWLAIEERNAVLPFEVSCTHTHTHTRTHAFSHTHTHTRTHTRTHAPTHTG